MTVDKFQIDRQENGSAIKLHLRGELDLAAAAAFREALESVVYSADRELTLDLEKLAYIDSTGIGILVSAVKTRDKLKASLYVTNIPPKIKRLFDMTGISPYLNEGVKGGK
ncbi:STAS domain-containing protein [Paenibacillus ferrarius]|uniref:STAS domain-containing protein n=1 Tax=Paenibacillus ferrarius TaxID=1469647 RepID=UPI003D2D4D98